MALTGAYPDYNDPLVPHLEKHCHPLGLVKHKKFKHACFTISASHLGGHYMVGRFTPRGRKAQSFLGTMRLFRRRTIQLGRLKRRPRVPALLTCFRRSGCLCLIRRLVINRALFRRITARKPCNRGRIQTLLSRLLPILQFVRNQNMVRQSVAPAGVVHHGSSRGPVLVSFKITGRFDRTIVCRPNAQVNARNCTPVRRLQDNRTCPSDSLCDLNAAYLRLLAKYGPRSLCDPLRKH